MTSGGGHLTHRSPSSSNGPVVISSSNSTSSLLQLLSNGGGGGGGITNSNHSMNGGGVAGPCPPSPKSPGRQLQLFHRHKQTPVMITAVEAEDDYAIGMGSGFFGTGGTGDDEIPGPPHLATSVTAPAAMVTLGESRSKARKSRAGALLTRPFRRTTSIGSEHGGGGGGSSGGGTEDENYMTQSRDGGSAALSNSTRGHHANCSVPLPASQLAVERDVLQISSTEHVRWSGGGILANRADLDLPPEQFAAGCNLLQAAARGDLPQLQHLLESQKNTNVNFRDYDRRTALHVAASEGHLEICKFLIFQAGAKVNRSDRWGGSPLDDAHRHRHTHIVQFLRELGATTGSGNRTTNLITAAADGDVDEVSMLLKHVKSPQLLDINKGDYDRRTALHLAAGEGHSEIVKLLCQAGADVNVEDRWYRRPLDDADMGNHPECVKILQDYGAARGTRVQSSIASSGASKADAGGAVLDQSQQRIQDNMRVDFEELEMIDRIGAGAFGEIYKCRWRGTLVAAKIIKSAKIRRDWVNKRMMDAIQEGKDVDDAIREIDAANEQMVETKDEKSQALADFRQEVSVLKQLRHPNIVLLLAYSTTENYECLISELMKCSLLDVFKSHMVQGTRMKHKTQIIYATQLSRGMTYLHSCKPPIIHRDLKPANLLIDPSGVLKISDFGLSRIRPDPNKKESDTFVMTGETGSYRFMAPEVYRREFYNETVDVYSYAMILFHLLTGRPPWPTLPGMQAVKRAAEQGDRPNIPRDLDVRLQNLLKECWDDNPSLRPPFTEITKTLTAYSKDVFNEREDTIVNAPTPDVDSKCTNCAIM